MPISPKRPGERNPIERMGDRRCPHPFQKGVVQNPLGRPTLAKAIPDILRRIGDEPAPERIIASLRALNPNLKFEGMNNREAMLQRVYLDAELGQKDARDFVAERTEGKIRDYIDITTKDKEIKSSVTSINFNKLTKEKVLSLRQIIRETLRERNVNTDDTTSTSAS